MKRVSGITAIIACVFILAGAGPLHAASYTVFGYVYNADGSIGNAMTENSYCGLKSYRAGIPDEIGPQVFGPVQACTQKIFWAGYNVGNTAYYNSDVGSSQWLTTVAVDQQIIAVVQVYEGQFAFCVWHGPSYVGARKTTVIQADIDSGESDLTDIRLQPVPELQISAIGASGVTLTWTGIAYDPDDLILSYTVYRSTEAGGAGGFGEIGTAGQVTGGTVTYNDTGLSDLYTYYYQLAVNFEWGGGNGAPEYYVTDARSAVSSGVYTVNSPTPTQISSATSTGIETLTVSETKTETGTATETVTYTETATPTATVPQTFTGTCTDTPTATYSKTLTLTLTGTATQTVTPTVTSALVVNLEREKLALLNSPITNGRLKIGVYSRETGMAFIYVYNISGEMVYKSTQEISSGVTVFDESFKKARGVYILRLVIKSASGVNRMPIKRFAVIKNNYE